MTLRIVELSAASDLLPFECCVPGFDSDWWCDGHVVRGHRYLSVLRGDVEVARVELDPQSSDVGEGVAAVPADAVVKIEFFEVREDYRGEQVGRDAIALIGCTYPDRWMVALSAAAGGFWRAIGWVEAVPREQPDVAGFRYVRAPTRQ